MCTSLLVIHCYISIVYKIKIKFTPQIYAPDLRPRFTICITDNVPGVTMVTRPNKVPTRPGRSSWILICTIAMTLLIPVAATPMIAQMNCFPKAELSHPMSPSDREMTSSANCMYQARPHTPNKTEIAGEIHYKGECITISIRGCEPDLGCSNIRHFPFVINS